MVRKTQSVVETALVAAEILTRVKSLSKEGAIVLALYGDLGSGKTTFVQELGKLLGIRAPMQSPTFVIMKRYTLDAAPFKFLIHIDAYRLEKPEELSVLGWEELIKNPENLIALEWADRVEELLPKDCIRVHFTFIDEHTREISL